MSSRSIIVLCVFWVYIKVHFLLVNQFYLWSTYTLITSLDLEFYQTELGCWNHSFCNYCCVFCIVCTQVWCKGLISVVSICEFWTRIVWYCGCGIIVHHHLHICIAISQLWWLSPYVSAWLSSTTWRAWRLCWFHTPLLWVFGLVPFITSAKLIINHLLLQFECPVVSQQFANKDPKQGNVQCIRFSPRSNMNSVGTWFLPLVLHFVLVLKTW